MASDKLDDLVLLEKLAAGGMAEVYRAIQQGYGGFEKVVAVKRILPHFASDEEFKNMFVMEAQLSGLLQHPNVVQVFSNGESEGYLYLVMEFVDGKNLRQLLARADKQKVRIPIECACFVLAEAAKGLEYAHSFVDQRTGQGMEIVHRDMSPQNIMLSYDGGVKIVDFGIAKAAARSEHTRAGVLKGKFGYMSPEQAQGMPIDRRSDIFALGIIFFELLTQRRLFSHDDDMRTLQLIRECNVPRPSKYNPSISPALDRIVLKALAKNRSDRYATASELYADIHLFMNQKYPQFLSMEFAKLLKTKIFHDDIATERKKREEMAAEAPARLGGQGDRRKVTMPQGAADSDKDATKFSFDDVSEVTNASQLVNLPPPQAVSSAPQEIKTRLTDSEFEELDLPLPGNDIPAKISKSENAAFASDPNPNRSHLSLSVTMGDKGPPLAVRKPGLPVKSQAPREMRMENIPSDFVGRKAATAAAYREIPFGTENGAAKRAFGGRTYLALMFLAASGAYMHFHKVDDAVAVVATNDNHSTGGQSAVPVPAKTPTSDVDRQPASRQPVLDAPAYMPEGATGYLNLKTFPSATEVYVDGRVLVDKQGAPIRAPANLQKVEVGTRKVILRNKALGLSWEGEVSVEFDTVKTLEVRLK
ncbi:MAG: serine/threonine-protein kinase [Bdellovibrionota bacterium]